MKFIVQKIEGKIVHDFAFELTQAEDYYKWLGKEELEIVYVDDTCPIISNPDDYIPVGSVEFVSSYMQTYYPEAAEKALKPLNVPECLFDDAGRWISNVLEPDDMCVFDHQRLFHGTCKKLFRKSLTKIKDESNGLFDYDFVNFFIGYQVSEEIPIDSEWRVFIFHDQIQHIANYSGDCLTFPDEDTIKYMVKEYSSEAPIAYTLDVGVRGTATFVIECHRFFSCGLYGFCDHAKIPKMLSQCWYQMKYLR